MSVRSLTEPIFPQECLPPTHDLYDRPVHINTSNRPPLKPLDVRIERHNARLIALHNPTFDMGLHLGRLHHLYQHTVLIAGTILRAQTTFIRYETTLFAYFLALLSTLGEQQEARRWVVHRPLYWKFERNLVSCWSTKSAPSTISRRCQFSEA